MSKASSLLCLVLLSIQSIFSASLDQELAEEERVPLLNSYSSQPPIVPQYLTTADLSLSKFESRDLDKILKKRNFVISGTEQLYSQLARARKICKLDIHHPLSHPP